MAQEILPADWINDDTEMLDGLDITDKSELIGKPLRINSVYFRTNASGVQIVQCEAELVTGEGITFTDSSTGVREQIADYLTLKNKTITDGEVFPVKLVIPRGLRVSNYEIEIRGKMRPARTYYLTTSGKSVVSAPKTTVAKK